MKYKEFCKWANDRACDGRWGIADASFCSNIIRHVQQEKFWRREKLFQQLNRQFDIENTIVKQINKKIESMERNMSK